MCGIAGFFDPFGFREADLESIATNMRDQLIHRGPDDAGNWLDGDAGIALTHRRLSVLDLSTSGHQPMKSESGRYVLVFNGEVYNHQDLRKKMEGVARKNWCGHSDTETILAAVDQFGLEQTLKDSVGMFALALWDRHERSLTFARDRIGEKPLFYGWQNGVLLFGSELKALRAHPNFSAEINRDALALYFRHGYIPSPWCIWKGIYKLRPGTFVRVSASNLHSPPEPVPYWSFLNIVQEGIDNPFVGSDEEAIHLLERHLQVAIAGQMVADVPLGAFLSGGVDSTTVVALMQAQSSRPVKTFTIGFHESGFDETKYAKRIADHLGTDHTELYVSVDRAKDLIPGLAEMYDEPFGDSSAIPTHLVSRLARESVTVSLSGDGGDELFGGYERYFNQMAQMTWLTGRKIPSILRRSAVSLLRFLSVFSPRLAIVASILEANSPKQFYQTMISQWHPSPVIGLNPTGLPYGLTEEETRVISKFSLKMMAEDILAFLPDDILVKVDRAAMAVSLETRVPLLDHRLIDLAWKLPYKLKVRNGQGKWLLRQVLYRYVPRNLMDRPKMGFGIPVDRWIRSDLRDWAEELLNPTRLVQGRFVNSQLIQHRWNQHLQGSHNWRDSLWLTLMWQSWLERNTTGLLQSVKSTPIKP
jgi:asparagine synthase (glutamine-hydrolysing)